MCRRDPSPREMQDWSVSTIENPSLNPSYILGEDTLDSVQEDRGSRTPPSVRVYERPLLLRSPVLSMTKNQCPGSLVSAVCTNRVITIWSCFLGSCQRNQINTTQQGRPVNRKAALRRLVTVHIDKWFVDLVIYIKTNHFCLHHRRSQ